jgi:hypothetical protein
MPLHPGPKGHNSVPNPAESAVQQGDNGVDVDPKILPLTRPKIDAAGADIELADFGPPANILVRAPLGTMAFWRATSAAWGSSLSRRGA